MAKKKKSIIGLRGTLNGETHVQSKRYGEHVRAPRGTYKKAKMNKKCVAVRKQVHKSNRPAQQIHGTLRPYSVNFKDGGFWARLVSVFHEYYNTHRKFDFKVIENMEVHEDYRLEQYLNLRVSVSGEASRLQVTLTYGCHPVFERAHYINGYCFTVIAIYPDLRKKAALVESMLSPVISMKGEETEQSFALPLPKTAKEFVVCVKLEGTEDGRVVPGYPTKGMRIVKVGKVGGK